jgi:hypothetical protein
MSTLNMGCNSSISAHTLLYTLFPIIIKYDILHDDGWVCLVSWDSSEVKLLHK